jgi:hypothetical protein
MVRLEADEQASGYVSGGRRPVVKKVTSTVTDKGSFRAKLAERLSCRERRRKGSSGPGEARADASSVLPGQQSSHVRVLKSLQSAGWSDVMCNVDMYKCFSH